jgi:hypothetical protein
MLSDIDRKILARACGLGWPEPEPCPHCGYYCNNNTVFCRPPLQNPTFTTPDDWELVRVKVVVPHITINPSSFSNWICMRYSEYFDDSTEWILTMAPAECCQMVADFIKESPDLFPWVEEMEGVKE